MNKKTVKKLLSLTMAAVLALAALAACETGGGNTPEHSEPTAGVLDIVTDGKSDFAVVYSLTTGTASSSLAKNFTSEFEKKFGVKLKTNLDSVLAPDGERSEILIGVTNREESSLLRTEDYFIGVVGKKLIIAGGSESTTEKAIDVFFEKLANSSDKSLSVGVSQNISYTDKYSVSGMTLGGVNIGEFEIVIPDVETITERRTALSLQDIIKYNVGYYLPIVSERQSTRAHKLYIGKREASENSYSLELADGNLYVSGSCYEAYAEASNWLKKQLFLAGEEGLKLDTLSKSGSVEDRSERAGEYRILINNIYGGHQPEHPFAQRGEMLAELYAEYDADVIGLQEFTDKAQSIASRIEKLGYTQVSVSSGSSRNCVPLYYKADKFTLVDSGFHRYTDGQNDNSKAVTWAVFKDKSSGDIFAVASTHFAWKEDSIAGEARLTDATQLLEIVADIKAEHSCPVFFGGDFNCYTTSAPYKKITDSGAIDVQTAAAETVNKATSHSIASYNTSLGIYSGETQPANSYINSIDHIFFDGDKNAVDILKFNIVCDLYALLSTDHCPLVLDFSVK